jgi:ADP-ribose pyrophosphatase YjhB (NUDIX family)
MIRWLARVRAALRSLTLRHLDVDVDQAAVIPVRWHDGAAQVCLIRRKSSSKWGIPKGFIEDGAGWSEAALVEAHEEAGLDGRMVTGVIGTYDYDKGALTLTVAVGVMAVVKERSTWPEMRWRERRWCSVEEAGALLKGRPVWRVYDRLRPELSAIMSTLMRVSRS